MVVIVSQKDSVSRFTVDSLRPLGVSSSVRKGILSGQDLASPRGKTSHSSQNAMEWSLSLSVDAYDLMGISIEISTSVSGKFQCIANLIRCHSVFLIM